MDKLPANLHRNKIVQIAIDHLFAYNTSENTLSDFFIDDQEYLIKN